MIPECWLEDFLVGSDELAIEQLRLEDRFTNELFGAGWPASLCWTAPVSRLVVDVERFRSDDLEPCASVGMGAVYVRGTRGQALRRRSPEATVPVKAVAEPTRLPGLLGLKGKAWPTK